MIEIKIMTEAAYKTLQKNYKEVTQLILDHPSDSSWLKSYLGFEPYEIKKYEVEDFKLDNDEDYSKVALKNSITLYKALNSLPRYILCNIRFWAWLTFDVAYKQAINTLPVKESIIKSWWLPDNSRRDLMLQIIGRSYFRAEVSYDPSAENPFALTEYLLVNTEAYRSLVFRNIGMLSNVSIGFIKALKHASDDTKVEITTDQTREVMKETSKIGSVMLIDALNPDQISEILYPKIIDVLTK